MTGSPPAPDPAGFPCPDCRGSMIDPAGVWDDCGGVPVDFCRNCGGDGRDPVRPPCRDCGAMTAEEAGEKCICAGDIDSCHGCNLWQDGGLAEIPSAEERAANSRELHKLHVGNRFRLMFNQPLLNETHHHN